VEKHSERYLTERDREILNSFPTLSQAELDEVNGYYMPYVFYKSRKDGRDVSCTTCHNHQFIPFLKELETPEDWEFMASKHNDAVRCPFCGAEATLKNVGSCKSFEKLREYHNVAFFHAVGEAVFVQCYWTQKNYAEMSLHGYPLYSTCAVYHFAPGEARMFYVNWGNWQINYECAPIGKRIKILDPFGHGGMNCGYEGYHQIGFDTAIAVSPFRYCQADKWRQENSRLMRFLTVCSLYPRAVEMFMKNGMMRVVKDLVYYNIKNALAVKWAETDPRKAFGLNGQELKAYMALSQHDADVVAAYKKVKKRGLKMSFQELYDLKSEVRQPGLVPFVDCAKKWNTTPVKLHNYLDRYVSKCSHGGGFYSFDSVYRYWQNYINAARDIGYDMKNSMVVFPKRLDVAHDDATAEHNRRLAKEREQARREEARRRAEADAAQKAEWERQERERLEREAKEREGRENRYCFAEAGYFIRPAHDADEIIAEGKILEHCVGGYGARHEKGALTICLCAWSRNRTSPS
jgi:hypothetical protein